MRILLFIFLISLLSCQEQPTVLSESITSAQLPQEWYKGDAEISVYELQQNRYNAIHPGQVVTVFVTEDFLTDKQVKNDNYTSDNSTGVLKMNRIKRFTTGIYDYSIFSSVFTNVKKSKTYKVTTSSQDWCGQSYMQLNRDRNNYKVQVRSYFENEGDTESKVKAVLAEDEIPNLIRLDTKSLPLGDIELLPSTEYTRLKHIKFDILKGKASTGIYVGTDFTGNTLRYYTIEIPTERRAITYVYEDTDMKKIVGWTDTYPSAFDKKPRTTIAKLKFQKWLPYWNMNGLDDADIRNELGI